MDRIKAARPGDYIVRDNVVYTIIRITDDYIYMTFRNDFARIPIAYFAEQLEREELILFINQQNANQTNGTN